VREKEKNISSHHKHTYKKSRGDIKRKKREEEYFFFFYQVMFSPSTLSIWEESDKNKTFETKFFRKIHFYFFKSDYVIKNSITCEKTRLLRKKRIFDEKSII
jgi:hypothetical protein